MFAELVVHPTVIPYVAHLLVGDLSISDFSANIALPRSRCMNAHNDQSSMRPFEAPAGPATLMDGCLWHTSGENTTTDREWALLFAFYARSFLRHQNNWGASRSRATKERLDPQLKEWLGLGARNMAHGTYLASF